MRQAVCPQFFLGRNRQNGVTIDDFGGLVDQDGPVGIAVESQPDVRPGLADQALHVVRVEQDFGGHPVARAVGAVDDDFDPVQGQLTRKGGLGKDVVAAQGVIYPSGFADGGRGGPQMVDLTAHDQRLEVVFQTVGQLEPIPRENLDSVILERVVRGGDHDAGICPLAAGQKGNPGSRQGPDQEHIGTHRTDAGRQGGLKHIARQTGVLADQNPVPTRHIAKHIGQSPAEP